MSYTVGDERRALGNRGRVRRAFFGAGPRHRLGLDLFYRIIGPWWPAPTPTAALIDWFRFELVAGATEDHYAAIQFDHDQGDLALELRDKTGSLRYFVSDTSRDVEGIRLSGLPADTYLLAVHGRRDPDAPDDNATNPDYRLVINGPGAEAADWSDVAARNDAADRATNLRSVSDLVPVANARNPLSIHEANDVDWFRFTLDARGGKGHFAAIEFDHALGDLDLELYRRDGDSPTRLDRSVSVTHREMVSLDGLDAFLPDGETPVEYLLKVAAKEGTAGVTNPYYLLTIIAPAGREDDISEGDGGNDDRERA